MKRALITGATGFIGSHLVQHLERSGWEVTALVRASTDVAKLSLTTSSTNQIQTIVDQPDDASGDRLASELEKLKPDVVFHLASLFLAAHQPADIPRLVESNVLFGTRLLEAMKRAGCHSFINTGTAWQHFENHQDQPVNLYAATKSAFESIVDYYASATPLRSITLKLFDTYGDNDPRAKIVHLLMKTATSGSHLALSPGDQKIDIVHVNDVVRAFAMAADRLLKTSGPCNEKYVVSSGAPLALKSLVATFEKATATKVDAGWGERPYREREVMTPYSLGKGVPGWKPEVSLHDGLKAAFKAFQK